MSKKDMGQTWLIIVAIVAIISVTVVNVVLVIGGKSGNQPSDYDAGGGVVVSATGECEATPDIARFSITFTDLARSSNKAQEKIKEQSDPFQTEIKKYGVDEKDTKSLTFSVYPEYDNWWSTTRKLKGYRATHTIEVTVREFGRLGEIIDTATESGASYVSNIDFDFDDIAEFENIAREDAMRKAKDKAETLAKMGGGSLGKPRAISENVYGGALELYNANKEYRSFDEESKKTGDISGYFGPSMPPTSSPILAPGIREIVCTVEVVYDIK